MRYWFNLRIIQNINCCYLGHVVQLEDRSAYDMRAKHMKTIYLGYRFSLFQATIPSPVPISIKISEYTPLPDHTAQLVICVVFFWFAASSWCLVCLGICLDTATVPQVYINPS